MGVGLPFGKLSQEDVELLEAPFEMDELKEVIWEGQSSKAPGPVGYNFNFYRKARNFIREDLMQFLANFHSNVKLEKGQNSSFITLIPKVENLIGLKECRPISLALIAGRQIMDGILLANEVIHSLASGKVDQVDKIMCQRKGIGAGKWFTNGRIRDAEGIMFGPSLTISHLQFADDTIMFLEAREEVIYNMKMILKCFELCLGLRINFSKSVLYATKAKKIRVESLASMLDCKYSNLPFLYLGISAPAGVIKKNDQLRRNFSWGRGVNQTKIVKVSWSSVCEPKKFGGLSIRNLVVKNEALLAKWWWRFAYEPTSLWRRVANYGTGSRD
ncbi:uncharacterized protein LOC111310749 [Durio zibethinus]|uniref:Uncharacterized protein LOC111310749 n=1 Tax=Durio zibethinus TaxID=66656 RepID=A0A6P6AM60_DURZI|nr:uncharacterized protein LOC111310749 [Durio zibethinus]